MSKTELETLPTHRLLSYLKKLHLCEEDAASADATPAELRPVADVVFKSGPKWKVQQELLKAMLAGRPQLRDRWNIDADRTSMLYDDSFSCALRLRHLRAMCRIGAQLRSRVISPKPAEFVKCSP